MPIKLIILLIVTLIILFSCAINKENYSKIEEKSMTQIQPPIAKQIITKSTFHGDERIDKYAWLRDDTRKDKEVLKYLEEENRYANSILESSKELKEKIYKEITSKTKKAKEQTNSLETEERNGYFYYHRNEDGKDHPIYCRKKGSMESVEEIYFDVNLYAKDHEFYDIGLMKISPNQEYMIFTVDTTGAEIYTLRILNLTNGNLLEDTSVGINYSEWSNDNNTFFYAANDGEKLRPFLVKKHIIGRNMTDDELLFEEKDKQFEVEIQKSKNEKYIFLFTEKQDITEYYYLDANKPNSKFKIIISREKRLNLCIRTNGEKFYIWMSDEKTPNGKLIETQIGNNEEENWNEILPHRDNTDIDWNFSIFEDVIIFTEKDIKLGLKRFGTVKFPSNKIEYIKFPEELNVPELGINSKFDADKIRVSYSSLSTPDTYYDYNIKTSKLEFVKQKKIKLYEPSLYESKRLWAPSKDGVKVPISIVYRKDKLKNDGSNPAYIYAYGCFGLIMEPGFHNNMIPLLDRGVIFAIAHVRGSSMLGNKWYLDGKLLNRKNRAYDFIAATEYLIKQNYTNKNSVIASGGSAGGELMLTSSNMRPDLFEVVIADVSGADLLNKMLDPTIDGVIYHYDEIGNPQEKEYYDYIKSYCPYENIQEVKYPNMFLRTSLNDPRLNYWEPAKYTAKLREFKKGKSVNILKTAMIGGHFGSGDWYENRAEEYAFALKILGIDE